MNSKLFENELVLFANQDLTLKLKLERSVRRQLINYFKALNNQLLLVFERTGQIILSPDNLIELENILLNHNLSVIDDFLPIQLKRLRESTKNLGTLVKDKLKRVLTESTKRISKVIVNNYEKVINQLIQLFSTDLISNNLPISNSILAKLLKRKLASLITSKADTISRTETQKASELTKQVTSEFFVLQEENQINVIKQWRTVGDDRVRHFHQLANKQTKNLNEVFIVNNQQLLYPGDITRGATANNVINCRCSSFILAV